MMVRRPVDSVNGQQPRAPSDATPMLYTRMKDNRSAFEEQRNVVQHAIGLDGGGSVCADKAGNVYVAWHGAVPGKKGEENRRVWVARSTDEGQTFAREQPAFAQPTGACGCCGMRAFADRQGKMYMLYRSAQAGVNRDTYLLVSENQGASFQGQIVHKWNVASWSKYLSP